jgi:hypothetical protein
MGSSMKQQAVKGKKGGLQPMSDEEAKRLNVDSD